jgi:hypothetical protein
VRGKTNAPFSKRLVLLIELANCRNIARIHEIEQRDVEDRHRLEKSRDSLFSWKKLHSEIRIHADQMAIKKVRCGCW